MRKHFPNNNKHHEIFNRNSLKLSYCCLTKVEKIKKHNYKVLSKTNDNKNHKCNCRSKPSYPLNGECLYQCLVYKVTSTTSNNSFAYYGALEWEFKTRFSNHKKSFRDPGYINETELSKHV